MSLRSLSNRAKLDKFSAELGNSESNTTDKTNIYNESNWQHSLVACGSNAFSQLSANTIDLMRPIFGHVEYPYSRPGAALVHLSCCGNQTAAVVSYEFTDSSNVDKNNRVNNKSNKKIGLDNQEVKCRQELYLWGSGKSSSQMKVPVQLPSPKCRIKQLSCGETHAGFIATNGQVFTWGSGSTGMLGHGTKSNVSHPRRVDALKTFVCSTISCGAYHTAFICAATDEATFIRIPQSNYLDSLDYTSVLLRASATSDEEYFTTGDLYTCGLGKAGQLGLGPVQFGSSLIGNKSTSSSGIGSGGLCLRPTRVPFFDENGLKVVRVSAGFHHTLVVAVPVVMSRVFSPTVYSFGFGEHGRLGLGHEEQVDTPMQITFPDPFHCTQVVAGEQHSLAVGNDVCYAWGNNSMGQLGIGSPQQIDSTNIPHKVAVPEGMVVRQIAAGSRHTAAITHCGQVLTWGWGEEGQLGHGGEKNCYLPRPMGQIPLVHGVRGAPKQLALGATHTFIMLQNLDYREPEPESDEDEEVQTEPEQMQEIKVEQEVEEEQAVVTEEQEEEHEIVVDVPEPQKHKPPSLLLDDSDGIAAEVVATPPLPDSTDKGFIAPIRSIKELLQQREERRASSRENTAADISKIEAESEPLIEPEPEPVIEPISVQEHITEPEPVIEPISVPEHITEPEPVIESEREPTPTPEPDEEEENDEPIEPPKLEASKHQVKAKNPPHPGYNVFYKEGQNLEGALVGNYARRQEIRKQRQTEKEERSSRGAGSSKHQS